MRFDLSLVMAILLALGGIESSAAQDAPAPASRTEEDPTSLEDVVVSGQRAEQAANDFVNSVGASAPGRKLAAWKDMICVGVAGMQPEAASVIADRVSDWGYSLALRVGEPGCTPNIVILAASDGDAMAQDLVARRPRNFRTGVSGTTAGTAALREFQTSGRMVRWWHVSVPVNADNLTPVVRLHGQQPYEARPILRPADLDSFGMSTLGSRLSDNTRDLLSYVVVIVESSALEVVNFSELSEYISMVSLSQINADTLPSVPSILNLFDNNQNRERSPSLTDWDRAYLRALYGTSQGSAIQGVNNKAIAAGMARRVRDRRQAGAD